MIGPRQSSDGFGAGRGFGRGMGGRTMGGRGFGEFHALYFRLVVKSFRIT